MTKDYSARAKRPFKPGVSKALHQALEARLERFIEKTNARLLSVETNIKPKKD